MSKIRKIVLTVLTVCMTASASVALAACAKNTYYANIKNPSNTGSGVIDEEFTGRYEIKVQSKGGLGLDGVQVNAVKNGQVIKSGISIDGLITLDLYPDVYILEIVEDTLPLGYYIPDELMNVTTSATNGDVVLPIPSKVISTTASSSFSYSLGDVMYDFSYTNTDGEKHLLSEAVEENRVVVLNFFYTTCSPCLSEFPVLNEAYSNFTDNAKVIALAYTGKDNETSVANFRAAYPNYLFDMALDVQNIGSLFGVTAYPTTVVVDRYGVICEVHEGSIVKSATWTSMFRQYTADDYEQKPVTGTEDETQPEEVERIYPTVSAPDNYTAYAAAVMNGDGAANKVVSYDVERSTDDWEYSWPWLSETIDGKNCLVTTNAGQANSFATLHVTLDLEAGDVLSYDYYIDSEEDDILYVLLNGTELTEYSGQNDGWAEEYGVYTAMRTGRVDLAFVYYKNSSEDGYSDLAAVRNISIVNAKTATKPTDIPVEAYDNNVYVSVALNEEDGYYHLYDKQTGKFGQILLANITSASQWSDLHAGGSTRYVTEQNVTIPNSLYHISFYYLSNSYLSSTGSDYTLQFDYGHTDDLISNYYLQQFSDNGYTPVTEELKATINAFLAAYKNSECSNGYDGNYDENTWLQFCVYFNHYGADHAEGAECFENADPVRALHFDNAYTVEQDVRTTVDITKILKYFNGGGLFYKFTAPKTGVYFVRSYTKDTTTTDPYISLYGSDRNYLYSVDDDLSVTTFKNSERLNFYAYFYLEEGESVYLQCRMTTPGGTGKYDFEVNYLAEKYEFLRVATTEDGFWTWDTETGKDYYLAVDVILGDDDIYYQVYDDGTLGSKIYIDFVNPNYYDSNNHTLYEIVQEGLFGTYTAAMKMYYQLSVYGKSEDDPLYGKIEADSKIVNIINSYLLENHNESSQTNYWLALACYFEYYGY